MVQNRIDTTCFTTTYGFVQYHSQPAFSTVKSVVKHQGLHKSTQVGVSALGQRPETALQAMSIDRERERGRDRDRDGDGERKGPPNVEGLFTLKVDNISFKTTADILREEFKRFGSLGDVYLPRNYSTNEPRGFAFVRFVNREDGEDALRSMDGKTVDGRELRIQEAKERRAENPKEHMVNFIQ